MRKISVLLVLALCTFALAQIKTVSRRSADFREIVKLVGVAIKPNVAYPVRVTGDIVRRCGDYAFLYSQIPFVNPKHQGDGQAMALLHKSKGHWKVLECTVGSGGMNDLAKDWMKKYRLPSALMKGVEE